MFCKATLVPSRTSPKNGRRIRPRLESLGVVRKVERSDWASPIVCVPKRDASIRICGHFKVSLNQVLYNNPYTLPDKEDILATLGSGTVFSKIDLSNAYQQMELNPESKHCLTVNTHKGLYAYQRLAYGIASAPALFQSTMCEEAFQHSKSELMAVRLLVPYDAKRKLIVACDASPYGEGAVISHVMANGRSISIKIRSL